MFKFIHNAKAQSTIEYITLFTIIILAIFAMQKYVLRGLNGRVKSSMDSFGHGRQYDPKRTLECEYDYVYTNKWYSVATFEDFGCHCDRLTSNTTTCHECIENAGAVYIPATNTWERLCD